MQDSSGQERTKLETKVRIINTDSSLLLEVPPFVIFFLSFFYECIFLISYSRLSKVVRTQNKTANSLMHFSDKQAATLCELLES